MSTTTDDLTQSQQNHGRDKKRVQTRRAALLEFLMDGLWHPNYDCSRVGGLSFNCSLYALRKEGWDIESRHVKGGVWELRLRGKKPTTPLSQSLSGPQRRVANEFALAIKKAYGYSGSEQVEGHLSPWLKELVNED